MAIRILVAVALGIATALILGAEAARLGPIGNSIIQLIKIAATPLLFFTILRSVLETRLSWKLGRRMLGVAAVNLVLALGVGLLFSNLFRPGSHFESTLPMEKLPAVKSTPALSFEAFLHNLVPESLLAPFVRNEVLSIVLVALVFGFALKHARREMGHVGQDLCPAWVREMLRAIEILIAWIVKLVPLAVFGAVAKAVSDYGFQPVRGLLSYLAVGLGALLFHSAVVYGFWLFRFARLRPKEFLAAAKEPLAHAVGVNSSLATLPLTLQALRKLGVSDESAAVGAGIATNLNNDGILLYEAMAILFLAQAYGMHFDLVQQVGVAFVCLAAVLGVTGVPEAGFISLSVVIVALKMPTDLLPLLLTVDWIIARGRSAVNVLSDMTLSIVIDRWTAGERTIVSG